MRRLILISVASILVLGLVVFINGKPARAEDLSPEQAAKISENCVAIKNSLTQLHASDALLRVNRGQIYESMARKLMDTFNNRLSSNQLDNMAMTTVTSNYRLQLDAFRTNYILYEQKLSQAIRTDCESKPKDFHNLILEARGLRGVVYGDIQKLHRLIDDYRVSVGDFLLNYERASE